MHRRHVIGTTVAVVLVGLIAAACGSNSKSSSSGTTTTTAASSSKSTLPASISLTAVQDLSGTAGVPGQEAQKGMKVAMEEINSTGFLGTSKIDIKFQDSASTPTTGASLFTQAVSGDTPLIFGSVSSGTAVAEAPVAQRGKLPTIFTQAGSPGIVDAGEYIYRATPVQSSYIDITGQYMQKKGYKKVAMLVATDIPTLTGLQKSFTDMSTKYGYTVVATEQTTSKATDLSAQLSKIAGQKPDAVVILALAGQNPTVITQLRAAGFTGAIIGQQGMGGGVLKPLGAAANGIVWATDFNAQQTSAGAQKFAKLFQASQGSTANNFAAEGYDAVWLAARAIKAAGSVSRDAVLAGLVKVSNEGFEGALGTIKFKDRDEVASGVLVTMKDGVEIPVTG
jgi:branched-chain amino acid transport system substrate-binding protein